MLSKCIVVFEYIVDARPYRCNHDQFSDKGRLCISGSVIYFDILGISFCPTCGVWITDRTAYSMPQRSKSFVKTDSSRVRMFSIYGLGYLID